jgi:hypothetical protein
MSEIQDNEILADCAWFADKHRGENKQSGPYWSTIIRFPKLYDEAIRLQQRVDTLEDYIADYCSPIISDKYSEIEHLQARVQELEQERRWIPVSELSETIRALVYMSNDYIVIATYYKNIDTWKNDCGSIIENVIKYQPLPQPPKEEE